MERGGQKNLVLIIAREFASKLATPTFLVDAAGRLIYYNEPAEELIGRTFAEAGEISAENWEVLFRIEDLHGNPLPLEGVPGGVALTRRRPAHGTFRMTGLDGVRRTIAATAFPLFARVDDLVGVMAIFWQDRDGGSE